MDSINDMLKKGLAEIESNRHEIDLTALCAWLYLDSNLCNRRAMRDEFLECTRYVFNYGSKN